MREKKIETDVLAKKSLLSDLARAKVETENYVTTKTVEADKYYHDKKKEADDREGALSVREMSVRLKTQELIKFKTELEKVYGKQISIPINLT